MSQQPLTLKTPRNPVSILRKSISGRHRPVRVADGPIRPDVDLRRMLAGKPASEKVVCLCRLLNILANFPNLFLHTCKQCGP